MSMDRGRLADINLMLTATLDEGVWATELPLANLKVDSNPYGAPARCETPTDLSSSKFRAVLPSARAVDLVGLMFHTISLGAKYRLTMSGPDGDLNTPVFAGDWTAVYGSVFASEDLEFEDDNWFFGQLAAEDVDLYPRHLFIPLPEAVITKAIRLEIDDAGNDAGYFDLGWGVIARTVTVEQNFDRGRDLRLDVRDQVEEAPSGREFADERTPRRLLAIRFSLLQDAEARRKFDTGARARSTRPVYFLPLPNDPSSLLREAFPATFAPAPNNTFTYPGLAGSDATLREIIA